jgi:type VI secretion system secreted protein VgrG
MEELRADRETFQGGGDVTGLATGRKFTLSEGPHPADVGQYLVIASSIDLQSNVYESGTTGEMGESYHCTFTVIKATDQFRPARLTPKPVIQGLQTAVVTGPKGEEIYTDKYGRIKVQFFWDREGKHDENTTCFMRVATSWAGQGWGAIGLPRIGQEVVVAFLEGDPDQPLVVGSVYNGNQMPPYKLPDEKTKSTLKSRSTLHGSTANWNEIRFEDKKGSEQIFVNAEKDMDLRVENDSREFIGKDRHLIVKANQTELVESNKHAHVKGDHVEKIDGNMSLSVGSNRNEKIGIVDTIEAGQEVHLKAGMKVIVEAGVQISLGVGGNFVDISPAGVTIMGTMVLINSGGSPGTGTDSRPDSPKDPDVADDGTKTGKLN